MSPILSTASQRNRDECHPELILLIDEAILYDDFSVGEAYRTLERHQRLRQSNPPKTKVPYSRTMHRFRPSRAVHLIPYPSDWPQGPDDIDALHQFYQLHGVVKTVWQQLLDAGEVVHTLRWGGDWDGDDVFSDQGFDDLAHYELRGSE